jgi:hypothetical protein
MHWVAFALSVISIALFVVSLVWALKVRGKTDSRTGPEIGAELMTEKLESGSRSQGRQSLLRAGAFLGKGWAVERTAEYSYAEIKRSLREGRIAEAMPPILCFISVLGATLFGGLTMLLWPEVHLIVVAFGVACLAWAAYALYVGVRGFDEA